MKAQFKYATLNGIYIRLPVFAVIFIMNMVFIVLGSRGLLPLAAHITAVSLGGLGLGLMLAANIIGDITIARRILGSPEGYLLLLCPTPRWKMLLSGVLTMTWMDLVSMIIISIQVAILSINLADTVSPGVWEFTRIALSQSSDYLPAGIWSILLTCSSYLLGLLIVLFSVCSAKSILKSLPAPGFFAFLLGCLCLYGVNLSQILLGPLGTVSRFGLFITISFPGFEWLPLLVLLFLAQAAGLFILTSKFLEQRIDI
ncbi:MAG: hypothetical protein FWH12_05605 [Treponema sp.]|nr:hypothetical protein [Treponema sp.]